MVDFRLRPEIVGVPLIGTGGMIFSSAIIVTSAMIYSSPFPYAGIIQIRSRGYILRRCFMRHPQRIKIYLGNLVKFIYKVKLFFELRQGQKYTPLTLFLTFIKSQILIYSRQLLQAVPNRLHFYRPRISIVYSEH